MKNSNDIREELRLLCPSIAESEKMNVYSVPSQYFSELASKVLQQIENGIEPVYFFPNVIPYEVPVGYFNHLPEAILAKVKGGKSEVFNETEEISPLLNTISKKPVFNVPDGYFEKVQSPAVQVAEPAKVVSIKRSPAIWMKYAAAAVITSILAVGAFMFTGKDAETLQVQNSNPKTEVKNLSEEEIIDYLNRNAVPFEVSASNKKDKENEIRSAVKEMSDKEIQQFLQESAISDEI